ncbi:winged helix-turn-helix domain-containing protein [Methanobrevibacter sp.]|uniref:winged helix-turn-helix domain-containing protein n=1 Tax=Methanobrevibacter sp. TaxID=66852 RepID=UPI003867E1A5
MDDETLKMYGYVISSSYRQKSIKSLNESNKIPTDLAGDIGIRTNHVSKVLRELKDCGIVECIDESKRKNRVYRLTPKGQHIARFIE